MAVYTELDIDFEQQKYQKVNAKAGDEHTRFLKITCYNSGVLFPLDPETQDVYMRYKKSDGTNVFKQGTINAQGQAEIELTKQMLASSGLCYGDLLVLDKDGIVEENDGKIDILAAYILSTMLFVVNVQSMAFSNDALESRDDWNELSAIIELAYLNAEKLEGYVERAETAADIATDKATESINASRDSESWAVGEREGVPVPTTDPTYHNNAKYYAQFVSESTDLSEAWARGTRKGVPVEPTDETYNNNSKYYSEVSDDESKDSEAWAKGTRDGVEVPAGTDGYHDNSKYYSEQSSASADESDSFRKRSEAWAVGEIDGVPVPDTDETFENNAKFWADYAEDMYNGTVEYEGHAEAWAKGTIENVPVPSTDPAYHNNSKYWSDLARIQVEPFIHGAEVDYTLYASEWFSSSYSIEDDFPYEDYYMWIQPAANATLAQMKAFGNAILSSEDNQNILVADGIVPTIDIPCKLYLIAKMTP